MYNREDEVDSYEVEVQVEEINEEPKIENYELSLLMVGDALYHNDVYGDGKNRVDDKEYDYTHNLINIKDIVEKYDIAYYNQETILRRD